MSAQTARQSLPASRIELVTGERRLCLNEVSQGWLSASLCSPGEWVLGARMLAHRTGKIEDCRLEPDTSGRPVLWVDGTYFAVSETEVQAIRAAFPEIRVTPGA